MSATSGKILSCYYTGSDLEPEGVDGGIMTHLMCGWILMSKDGTVAPQDAKTAERFRGFVLLKNKWPSLKVLVSSGGGPAIAPIARNPTLRANYIHSVVDLLDEYGFDGLDVDWEYPVWNGKKCDKEICVLLMRELRETFNSRPRRMLLTMATAASKLIIDPAYDIPGIAQSVDFINLMGYDLNLFRWYNIWASYNAPMFPRRDQIGFFATNNISWAAEYWVEKGMPREKVVVGVPSYARTWKLLFPCWNGYNAPCVGEGPDGAIPYTHAMAFVESGAKRVFDSEAGVPFATLGKRWVSYEDEESILVKGQWIAKNGFGGAMLFSLDSDDWRGTLSSDGVKFPLTRVLYRTVVERKSTPNSPNKEV